MYESDTSAPGQVQADLRGHNWVHFAHIGYNSVLLL